MENYDYSKYLLGKKLLKQYLETKPNVTNYGATTSASYLAKNDDKLKSDSNENQRGPYDNSAYREAIRRAYKL